MKILSIVSCIIMFVLMANAQDAGTDVSFQFVGHRGASYLAPENTLASIRPAWLKSRMVVGN